VIDGSLIQSMSFSYDPRFAALSADAMLFGLYAAGFTVSFLITYYIAVKIRDRRRK
jgi:hypothetical protein